MKYSHSWLFSVVLIVVMLCTITVSAFASPVSSDSKVNSQSPVPQTTSFDTIAPTVLPCYSLDVVFVIDQSGSMGGIASVPANDPTGQRAFGPRWAIDFLADNALNVCPDAFHRVAMISFGDKADIDLPLSDINPDNAEEWTYIRSNLKASITEKSMGQTDPLPAFEEAIQILDNAGSIGNAPRKRVIIFMTDGMPCVEELGCVFGGGRTSNFDFVSYARDLKSEVDAALPFSENLLKQEQCIDKLRNIYGKEDIPAEESQKCMEDNRVTDEDYKNSTYLYTMLISYGSAWPKALRDVYSAMSTQHGGEVIDITENAKDIPSNFLNIMTKLAGVPVTRLTCGSFAVNPYVSQARLTFFKIEKNIPIVISYTDKDGVSHQMVDGKEADGFNLEEHYSEGANERYVFNTPYPGIWTIESDSCNGIDAYYEMVNLDLGAGKNPLRIWSSETGKYMNPDSASLPEYDIEPYYNADKSFYLSYEMVDIAGNVVKDSDNPVLGVKAIATVTQPDKQKQTLTLKWLPEEKKLRSETPLLLPEPGEYSIDLVGTIPVKTLPYGPVDTQEPAKVFDQQMELFRVEGIKFKAFEVTPLKLVVDSPTSGQKLRPIHKTWFTSDFKLPLKVEPITVKAHIVNEDGTPLDANAQILADPQQGIAVSARQGELTSQEFYLHPDASVSGGFTGAVEEFAAEKSQELVVKVSGTYDDHYRFVNKETVIPVNRVDGLFNLEITYKFLAVLIALIILINIVKFFGNRRNTVSGTLIFTTPGAPNDEFPLRGKRVMSFGPRALKDHDGLDLYRLSVENLTKNAKPKRQKGDDEESTYSAEDTEPTRTVRVKMCLISERKGIRGVFNAWGWIPRWDRSYEMNTNDSMAYSEQTQASVEYRG